MTIYRMKITLQGIKPPIWRRVEVAGDTTLLELHEVIQDVMGWEEMHLHMFLVNGREYGANDPSYGGSIEDERRAVLEKLVKPGERFQYVYDFGDDWNHVIKVEKALSGESASTLPRCLDGARACPPEDCGGPPGYAHLVEALARPASPEREDMLEWLGEDFDPEAFDLAAVNAAVSGL